MFFSALDENILKTEIPENPENSLHPLQKVSFAFIIKYFINLRSSLK